MKPICLTLILLSFIIPSFAPAEGETHVPNAGAPQAANPGVPPPSRGGSVYRISPAVDIPVLSAAALGATLPLLFESQLIHQKCPCDANGVNAFDRPVVGNNNVTAGTISDYTVGLALAVPLALDGADQGFNKTFWEDIFVYAESLAINTAVSHIARYGVQRPRPTAYGANPPETRAAEFLSFYSGHTASVFAGLSAASMTYGYRYGHKAWPWIVTAGVGVGESVLRVAAGRHFYTDVIAGAVAGTAVGTLVPYFHHRYRDSGLSLEPTEDDSGIKLVWRKNF